jgi:putative ABC transport system permease protein
MARTPFDDVWRDVRLACRALRATPVVTAVAVTSLALGIGANTAIFSVINSLLLRTLPVRDPGSLVLITDNSTHVRVWSYAVWILIGQRPELFERSAAWSFTRFNLASGGETQFVDGLWASGSFFDTLGVPALVGRTFSEVDDRLGGGPDGPVVMISTGFWQRRFGGSPDVIGRSLALDDVRFTIMGVTPPDFFGPEVGHTFDVIVPIGNEPAVRGRDSFLDSSGTTFLTVIARLRPNQSSEAATAELRRVQSEIRTATLDEFGRFASSAAIERYLKAPFVLVSGATGYAGARDLRNLYKRPLLAILVVVALLLLIACVNVANLLTSRAIARRHELSLRLALGASRWRLVRQVLTESAVLYGLGAAAGLALAARGSRVLVNQLSTPADTVFLDLSVDSRVLVFTLALTASTTLLFGTVPAFRASRGEALDALKERGRGLGGQGLGTLAGVLIVVQVALSLMLVVAAGLFTRTFTSLSTKPLGFEPSQVLVVNLDAHRTSNEPAQRIMLYERARDAVRLLPGVGEAALSLTLPVSGRQFTPTVKIDGVADTRGPVWANLISPGWLATFRTPLLAGRDLTDVDRAGTPRVAIVNEAFARKFAADGTAMGRTITLYPGTARALGPIEIVGIVGDAVYGSLRDPAPPTFYVPLAQFDYLTDLGIRTINLSVRVRTESPMALATSISTALATVSPQLAITSRPLLTQVNAALVRERLMALLSGFFGALALLLAGLGLYGVTAYSVASSRTEIGIRVALGASVLRAIRPILARTAVLVSLGVLAGTAISLWASTLVAALIYGVEPWDPATFAASTIMLAVVAGLAAWLPARRAGRIDPAAVLREG